MEATACTVCCSSAACPENLICTRVSSGQNCRHMVSRWGNVLRSFLFKATLTVGWISRIDLFRCILGPQWPVCRRKMDIWVLLTSKASNFTSVGWSTGLTSQTIMGPLTVSGISSPKILSLFWTIAHEIYMVASYGSGSTADSSFPLL